MKIVIHVDDGSQAHSDRSADQAATAANIVRAIVAGTNYTFSHLGANGVTEFHARNILRFEVT